MFYSFAGPDKYIIRLEKKEEIISSVKKFCREKNIKNAKVSAIGSIESPVLAHYRIDTKKYSEKKMNGIFELTSLVGNVGIFENEPLVHVHVNISDEKMRSFGGHLVEGIVSATVEVMLCALGSSHTKIFDIDVGLKLWNIKEKL